MTVVDLLSTLLVFAVACPTSVTPLASTLSPQESYSRFLQSLAGQKLGSTRAPIQDVSSFPAGSYESALQAGTFFSKISYYNCCKLECFKRTHLLHQILIDISHLSSKCDFSFKENCKFKVILVHA